MNDFHSQAVSADEAVAKLQSGMNIFVHGAAATPTPLLEALCRRDDLTGIKLYHLHVSGPAPFVEPACHDRIRSVSLFTGESTRKAVQDGHADFIPVFLSDIPALFRNGRILDPVAVPIFIAVGSYFLGIAFHAFTAWRRKGRGKGEATRFDDVRAAGTLAAMALVIVLQLTGWQSVIPHGDKLEALPLALMLFYFGSR